jgi:hypothetical protein
MTRARVGRLATCAKRGGRFDQEDGAAAIMEGWRVHYDMVRTHQALGKTPAEAADISPLVGFKWLELLKRAGVGSSNTDWKLKLKNEK